ncbi:MAG: hypothetical protein ACYCT0_10125 [Sulfobacillus sp.]
MDQIVDSRVVEDWDIASLETGTAIVSWPMGEPLGFRSMLYQP